MSNFDRLPIQKCPYVRLASQPDELPAFMLDSLLTDIDLSNSVIDELQDKGIKVINS